MTSESQDDEKLGFRHIRTVAFLAIAVFLLGVALAWTASRFALPVSSGVILGASITVSVMLLCCSSYLMTSAYSARIPVYEEMEAEFRKGMQLFENREWQSHRYRLIQVTYAWREFKCNKT